MKISAAGINLIKQFEGIKLNAYQDSVGIWTIGYGSIRWIDGKAVKKGEVLTMEGAEKLLTHEVEQKTAAVNKLLGLVKLTQNQFDAICSFTFNCGIGALGKSTLLRKVKSNTSDITIKDAFLMFNKGTIGGKLVELKGLTNRRKKEANYYFS